MLNLDGSFSGTNTTSASQRSSIGFDPLILICVLMDKCDLLVKMNCLGWSIIAPNWRDNKAPKGRKSLNPTNTFHRIPHHFLSENSKALPETTSSHDGFPSS